MQLISLISRFNTVTYEKHSLKYTGPFIWPKIEKIHRND